jgi:hypothetical protein
MRVVFSPFPATAWFRGRRRGACAGLGTEATETVDVVAAEGKAAAHRAGSKVSG